MPVVAVNPLMLIVMATILIQLQSSASLFLVLATAPLAVIGVALALVPTGAPLGFIAVLESLRLPAS